MGVSRRQDWRGETPELIIREIDEELGVNINNPVWPVSFASHAHDASHLLLLLYLPPLANGPEPREGGKLA